MASWKCRPCRLGEHCQGEGDLCFCECTEEGWVPPQVCLTCGCLQPENKHTDRRNITVSEFKASASATPEAPGTTAVAMRNARRTLKVAQRRRRK